MRQLRGLMFTLPKHHAAATGRPTGCNKKQGCQAKGKLKEILFENEENGQKANALGCSS